MAKFIKVTGRASGRKHLVNTASIQAVNDEGGKRVIAFLDGVMKYLTVSETVDKLESMIHYVQMGK